MSERLKVHNVDTDALELPEITAEGFRSSLLHHLQYSVGSDPAHASKFDWRIALSYAVRDRAISPWFRATRSTWDTDHKRVYYLSMEFLTGRLLEDTAINLGIFSIVNDALTSLGLDFHDIAEDEPDPALGNGGLGRLAACYLESTATLACPAYGYGIRYEHGLFKQGFDHGVQILSLIHI